VSEVATEPNQADSAKRKKFTQEGEGGRLGGRERPSGRLKGQALEGRDRAPGHAVEQKRGTILFFRSTRSGSKKVDFFFGRGGP